MIAKTLQFLIDEKYTTAKEVGELTGVATSTVYRWLSGQSQPDFNSIRLLVIHLPSEDAQTALLTVFTAGTPWQHYMLDTDLDVNHDGRIDQEDALTASIETVRAASESLSRLRELFSDPEDFKTNGHGQLQILNDVIRQCSTVQQILARLSENQKKRIKLSDRKKV